MALILVVRFAGSIMRKRDVFALLIVLLGPAYPAFAQVSTYQYTHLTTQDGLSQSYVYCILQDHRGFMWFGTRNGLNRYDGYSFKVYNHEPFDSTTISHNLIRCMVEDNEGNIWIGTHGGGLNRLDRRRQTFIAFRHDPRNRKSLTHDMINALCLDKDGLLWIATRGGGLCMLDVKAANRAIARGDRPSQDVLSFRNDPANPQSLGSDVVMGVLRDHSGVLWIATNSGCDRFDIGKGTWVHYEARGFDGLYPVPRFSSVNVRSNFVSFGMLEDRRSNIWLSNGALACYNPRQNCFDNLSGSKSLSLCEDFSGGILFGSEALCRLGTDGAIDRIPIPTIDQQYSPGQLLSVAVDRRRSIWVGTINGIIRIDRSSDVFRYMPYRDAQGMEPVHVRALVEDGDGEIWAGTVTEGVAHVNRNTSSIEHTAVMPSPKQPNLAEKTFMNSALRTRQGLILFGHGIGVFAIRSDGTGMKRIGYGNDDLGHTLWGRFFSLLEDARGTLWGGVIFSGRGFLYRIDVTAGTLDSAGRLQREIHRRCGSGVWKIFEDHRRRLWFGTSEGVIRFDPADSSIRQYGHDPNTRSSLAHNEVWEIFEDRDSTIWIGTMGGGLDRFDEPGDRFEHHTVKDGLADNVVKSILQDRDGHLWIGTDNGLSHFDPRTKRFRNYRTDQIAKAGAIGTHAAVVARNGDFLFGAENGVLAFHPDSLYEDTVRSPVVFTGMHIQGRSRDVDLLTGDTVTLEPSEKYIAFEFASLDYRNNKQLEYAFTLDGVTPGWVELGNRHTCSFANLRPGTYLLRIRGTNSDGVWSPEHLTLTLVVLPPFYLRWWFITLGIVLVLFSAGAAVRWRIGAVRRKAENDRRVVESELKALRLQMNPHFFFNALNAIQGYISNRDERQANTFITRFAQLMRATLENSRSATIAVSEEIATLTHYLELEAMRFNRRFEYRIDVDPAVPPDARIPSMLIQPYVENAVRHGLQPLATGGLLTVALTRSDDTILCRVEDNGIGREKARQSKAHRRENKSSLGMDITRERLEILNAGRKKRMSVVVTDLHDETGAACGTRVEIAIPME
jgi:ligand-binding sensor domain-containing protein/signal transduction histidine kinase